jgi:heterodisulfide reductase subunit B
VLGVDEELAGRMAGAKLKELGAAQVTALALVCPFCNVMYEGQQKKIAKSLETKLAVPVVYLTQVLGLGLGMSPEELGLGLNRVKPKELLQAMAG